MNNGRLFYRLAHHASRYARESWSLAKTMLLPKSLRQEQNQNWRVACLRLTQQDDNELARSLLKMDKEFHLLRYYGLRNYMEQRRRERGAAGTTGGLFGMVSSWMQLQQPSLAGSRGKDEQPFYYSTTRSNNNNNDKDNGGGKVRGTVAKVPFVITMAMKAELGETLGYTPVEMKQMTPLVATLLIQHQVDPKDMETRLPELIQKHEEQLEILHRKHHELLLLEHQQQQQQLEQQQQQEEELKNSFGNLSALSPIPSGVEVEKEIEENDDDNDSKNTAATPAAASPTTTNMSSTAATTTSTWYRVVEEVEYNDTIIDVPVGLHRTFEQAQQDRGLRQEMADRNHKEDRSSPKRHFRVATPPTSAAVSVSAD